MKDLVFKNASLKILSLLFAVSLWLFANLKATADRSMKLPVVLANLSSEYIITNTISDYINVKVDGPWRIISNLNPDEFPIQLDLSDAKAGVSTYQINEKMVHLPAGIKVTILFPDTIQVKLEHVMTRDVPVKANVRDAGLPEGYIIKDVIVTPKTASITGAKSEVSLVSAVETEEIDATGRRESFIAEVGLVPREPHVWPSPRDKKVKVHVIVSERTVQREFPGRPVNLNNAPLHATVDPPSVDVIVEGPASKVAGVSADAVRVEATVPEQKGYVFKIPLAVVLPEEQLKARCRPESVTVTIHRRSRSQ